MKRLLEIIVIVYILICCLAIFKSCKKVTEPEVTTSFVTDITPTSAVSGGNITNNGGAQVVARGVCWSTNANPTIDSNPNKTTDGTGNGTFSSTIANLSPNNQYHVRAYATNSEGTGYGNDVTFTTSCDSPSALIVGTIIQPTCSVTTGSVVLNGLPSTGTWTLTALPGGTTTTGTGSSTTITGLSAGTTYTFTVTNASGCVSTTSANVVINMQPETPSAPLVATITQPTCSVATGSVILSGLPSTGTWTLTRNPGGTISTGSGTSTTITGLSPGATYTFTVTNASGCVSAPSGNVVINEQLATPVAPVIGTITQPSCSIATGSVVLTGLPASGSWTLTRTPGSTTYSGTGTSYTISGLAAGTYTFTVTNVSGCISPTSANVIINSQPESPSAPVVGTITQPTCSAATGSVLLGGLPSSGNWTLTRNPGGITSTGSGTIITISGLAPGTYTFTVTNVSSCISPASGNITINPQPATPTAPVLGTITQPTCSVPSGSVVLTGLPSSGNWTLTRSPGGITTSGSGTSTTVSGLPAGVTYTFTVTNASGCVSASSVNVTINAQPTRPSASTGAYSVSDNDAIISGTVNANGATTTVSFNYGTTTAYGSTVTASPNTVSGNSNTAVNAMLTGLIPGTLYYYRVTATNCAGTTNANGNYFTTPPLIDEDGNTYDAVKIGTQVWMAENLKTTKYSDGTSIPNVTDNTAWSNLTTPGYCWFNNDPTSYKNTYGALYNFYAVTTGKLCPAGWHVPTDAEFKTLEMNLGMTQGQADTEGWRGTNQGTQLKSTTGWSVNGTNTSGFTALPGGYRWGVFYTGIGGDTNVQGLWWSFSKTIDPEFNWWRGLGNSNSGVYRYGMNNKAGLSVRCLRDTN